MFMYLRKSKLTLVILALAVVTGMVTFGFQSILAVKSEIVAVSLEEQFVEDTALVRLLISAIQEQSDLFYEPYYTEAPGIVDYFTTVKNKEEKGSHVYVTFSTLPYIGPHDIIGEDEITFSISHSGVIAMVSFKHLKSYPLPDNLKSIEKGALPPITK